MAVVSRQVLPCKALIESAACTAAGRVGLLTEAGALLANLNLKACWLLPPCCSWNYCPEDATDG